jgi:hypothetical protein
MHVLGPDRSVSHAVNDFARGSDSRISSSPTTSGERDGKDQAASEPEKSGIKIMSNRKGNSSNGCDQGEQHRRVNFPCGYHQYGCDREQNHEGFGR